jgi:vacuolar-type H+-ATPase subunit I/STV1
MATKHRGKAAQAAYARKQAEKIARYRENFNIEAAEREAERDHEDILATVAEARERGVTVATVIREQRLGRPPLDGETKTVQQVRLTAAQLATARRLGDGNASEGIRRALELGGIQADRRLKSG